MKPHASHVWTQKTPDGPARCTRCGAYSNLGSGFMECQPPKLEQPGISLREWYAGMALQGMNANPEVMEVVTAEETPEGNFEKMAACAFRQADAMLAESKKERN